MKQEPWFYGCLSYILPGLGQIWMGKLIRGVCFLVLFILIGISIYYFIGMKQFIACIPAIIWFAGWHFLLPLVVALDAVKQAKLRLIVLEKVPVERRDDEWFPVFLSLFGLLFGGLGYLYLKRWFYFTVLFFLIVAIEAFLPNSLVMKSLSLVLYCGVVTHVFILATSKRENIINSAAKIFFGLLATWISIYFGVVPLLDKIYHLPKIITINSSSMKPALIPGDWIVIDYRAYRKNEPQIGDIVILDVKKIPEYVESLRKSGEPIGEIICKRIVATAGDKIAIVDRLHVYVNGQKVNFASDSPPEHIQEKDLTPSDSTFNIPSGEYFLMGDNFYHSADSRFFGTVSREAIKGKVIKIMWPFSRAILL